MCPAGTATNHHKLCDPCDDTRPTQMTQDDPQLERIQTVEGGGNRQEGTEDGTDVLVLAAPWQTPAARLHPGVRWSQAP